MARCGRCGMFSKYPDNFHEKKYSGVCLWYQMRLIDQEVFEERECKDFFEAIPGVHAIEQMDYKIKRDNLGDAYVTARFSKRIALISLGLSIVAGVLSLIKL